MEMNDTNASVFREQSIKSIPLRHHFHEMSHSMVENISRSIKFRLKTFLTYAYHPHVGSFVFRFSSYHWSIWDNASLSTDGKFSIISSLTVLFSSSNWIKIIFEFNASTNYDKMSLIVSAPKRNAPTNSDKMWNVGTMITTYNHASQRTAWWQWKRGGEKKCTRVEYVMSLLSVSTTNRFIHASSQKRKLILLATSN